MDFQTIRLYGSLFVILGCFVFLYPKLLHPLVLTMFGMSTKTETRNEQNDLPPSLRQKHPEMAQGRGGDVPDHIKRMRQHGPHPGMRAAAAEQKQTKGSGRGMMGVILPMYAVGIVVYLVYTLFKVFGKNDNKESKSEESPVREPRFGGSRNGDDPGRVTNTQSDSKSTGLTEADMSAQLEQLKSLANSMKENSNEMDMRKLQERLAETEAQMTKILAAMQSVQTNVGDVGEQVKTATGKAEVETKPKPNVNEEKKVLNTSDRSSESSPESESYEIVNKSDRESSGEETSPQKVETLTSTTCDEMKEEEEDEEEKKKEDVEDLEEEEPTDEIIKDKEPEENEETKTVRKRVTKTEQES